MNRHEIKYEAFDTDNTRHVGFINRLVYRIFKDSHPLGNDAHPTRCFHRVQPDAVHCFGINKRRFGVFGIIEK